MSNSKPTTPSPQPSLGKNWPSKIPGKPSGGGRDFNPPKTKK